MAIPDPIPYRFTYEDYLLFPEDDGLRHELIGGEHFVTPAPFRKHQAVSMSLSFFLTSFLRRFPLGEVLAAPFGVVLSNEDVVQPDLIFISRERSEILTDKHAEGAPDLVVEILSNGTRKTDEGKKLRLYERVGVQEYWIFDPEPETTRVYRKDGKHLVLTQELSAAAGDVLETPLLPGLRIPLAEVFR